MLKSKKKEINNAFAFQWSVCERAVELKVDRAVLRPTIVAIRNLRNLAVIQLQDLSE